MCASSATKSARTQRPSHPRGKESAQFQRYQLSPSRSLQQRNMSVRRTPPRATLASDSESGSGSALNLYTLSDEDLYANINSRKRKQRTEENDYKKDFKDFRTEIMNFLNNFGQTQADNLNQIKEQIMDIKNEIKTIKISTENFSKQLERVNIDIENIKTKTTATEVKIKDIETEILQIKNEQNSKSTLKPPVECHENLILEIKDRYDRENNIVFVGIPEINDKNWKSRQHHDKEEVTKLITMLLEDCPIPTQCRRLGKYVQNKNRPLKVIFEHSKTAKHLLKNKTKLPETVKVFSDQTPTQKQYLITLKEELNKRTQNGEKNLNIKYVKGTPTIVVTSKKNL